MANVVLVGTVPGEINHQFSLTLYDLSLKGDRPGVVKFGNQGPIGSSIGQEKPSGSFKFAVPVTGLEFDWVAIMKNPGGFTFSFPIGAERHQIDGAQVSGRSLSNNPEQGDTVWGIEWFGTQWVRIS